MLSSVTYTNAVILLPINPNQSMNDFETILSDCVRKIKNNTATNDDHYTLGLMYLNGRGVKVCTLTACSYFLRAANNNHTRSQVEYAKIMVSFNQMDYARAYLGRAALVNDPEAIQLLNNI
jgi:TPR repeat protein